MFGFSITPLIITAAVSGSVAFGSAWQLQSLRMDAQEKDRAEQIISAQKIAFRRFEVDQSRVSAAQNAATLRIQRLRVDVAAAWDERDGLRRSLDEADRRATTASANALRQYTATINSVFEQCTKEYLGMAEKAQGHADDVRTLSDSWPKP